MPQSKQALRSTLDQGQVRLLRWLDSYPFQRAQDLVVALSPWESRAAVYRRLAELQARHLVEAVRVGISPREPLYHISPAGHFVCTSWRVGHETFPLPALRDERDKLMQVLPRVPVWLVMQDLVNSLVLFAARALTRPGTGEEAVRVRWNWMREFRHAWVERGPSERLISMHADGALSLCVRFTASPQDAWHTFLLLHCPLEDGRLFQRKLERLVRWRDCSERQSASGPLPPVLILATTARQAEWWHLAHAQVATRLRTEGLLGAVAILPAEGLENGWRLPWRLLGTNQSCHLPDLTVATPVPVLPQLQTAPASWVVASSGHALREAEQVTQVTRVRGRRSYALSTPAQAHAKRGERGEHGDYRWISVLLTARQWQMLTLLQAHPLLSREELSVFLGLREKSVQLVLADLEKKGLLTQAETPIGGRWHLAEAGLRLVARAARCHAHRLARVPVTPGEPLQQRGVAGLLHQVHHTAGIYSFFAELVRACAPVPGTRVNWWETGAHCEQVFTYREQRYHFKPDAFAAVQVGTRERRFWLEWDRGTMGVRDLERKCATYAAYLSSREWARGGASPPLLLYIAPEIAQERRFRRAVFALLAHLPALHVYTTTASLLLTQGILEAIWQPLSFQPAALETEQRRTLFDLSE